MTISPSDLHIKTVWGLSLTEWNDLDDTGRAYYRDHVAHAEPKGTR